MDNILQALFKSGPRKDSLADLLAVYMGGARVNPQGGTYRDFEEPLSMQYNPQYEPMQIMDPMVQGLMTPEIMQILTELKRKREEEEMDRKGTEQQYLNPKNFNNNLGVGWGN